MLNKEEILRKTHNGLDVFRHYISVPWKVGRNFLNPLYNDTRASCNIFFDRNSGCYRLHDFGNSDFSGDCFFYVGQLINLDCRNAKDFVGILKTINQDLSLGLEHDQSATVPAPAPVKNPCTKSKKNSSYNILSKHFSSKELSYWQQSGITCEILKKYHLVSLREFQGENRNGNPYTLKSSDQEPIFAYVGKQFVKIYMPDSSIRFLYGGELPENYCFGLEQLPAKGDLLFITGGEKDVLTLASHGFHAICFNSETALIPPGIIRKLSNRFKHIVLLYDVDQTGIESAAKHHAALREFSVKNLTLPLSGQKTEKDVSDYFSLGNTSEDLLQLFQSHLEQLYEETFSLLHPCEIDVKNPPNKSEVIIFVNDVPLGTQGNLLGITGGEGTGKSNYAGSLIAGSIASEPNIDMLGLQIKKNNTQRAVLWYDTEQSIEQVYKNLSNVIRRSGLSKKPDYLHVFSISGMSRKERLHAIIQSMDKFYYQYHGIQLIVIDGIADLVRTANDEAESVELIDELYRLAGIYNTCVVCVLHFTPNGLKLRGHLGSELQRKAAAILAIESDKYNMRISVVKALKVRDGSPLDVPLMQFGWDKTAKMHTYLGEKSKEDKEQRKEKELRALAQKLFSQRTHWKADDFCLMLQSLMDVKERTVKSYFQFMKEREIILNDPANDNIIIQGIL